ncbi:glycosyltransferase [Leucobacter insecticola]|uniref:glycosyltransferase n=1 Tax=Leucobacter insecticola TaxID=2714934 RepID=UPI0031381074
MIERGSGALVILPTYLERDTLARVVWGVRDHLPEADLLIIDDNSPDGTGALAEELAARDGHIKVAHRAGKLGLGTAYVHGFTYALDRDYQFVVEMDSDGSHLASELPGCSLQRGTGRVWFSVRGGYPEGVSKIGRGIDSGYHGQEPPSRGSRSTRSCMTSRAGIASSGASG